MRKNRRVVGVLLKLRFQRLMMFRLSFFAPFFVDGSLFVIQLLVFKAIYANVDRIGTWGKGEVIMFIGTFSLLNAVNMVVYFFGVNEIPNKIRSGEMDLYLSKPVSPLLRLSLENVNPGSIPLVIMSICIIAYGIHESHVLITGKLIVSYLFWLLLMVILYYEMEVIVRSVAFFLVSIQNVSKIEESGLEMCMQLPGIVFTGIYKVIFCVILPYGIMATIPVQVLIGELNCRMALQGFSIVVVFTGITMLLWKTGIRKYNSVNS
ncbi:MAG: ABC-2 family transporter protein [Clostridium sp.]|nr:ABC-2 family transporter protein [Clostridium sp.]